MRPFALVLAALLLPGCDVLFPEFSSPSSSDDGGLPDGGAAHLSGAICTLGDARDFHSCATGHGAGFRVTVEETRDVTTCDANGAFVLPLSRALDVATVAAIDPAGVEAPTIVTVRLAAGVADGLGLPVVSAQALAQAAALDGFVLDGQRGVVLAWAVDKNGAPVAGAQASAPGALTGPFYEGGGPNELVFGNATGAHGTLALFDVPAPMLALALAAPANLPLAGDHFTLPIRPGAVTVTTLLLPPRP